MAGMGVENEMVRRQGVAIGAEQQQAAVGAVYGHFELAGTTTIQTGPDATVRLGLPALSLFSGHIAAGSAQFSGQRVE
jgi:hypothetical protein